MALRITQKYSMITWKRAGVFVATLALLVQPIVTLNLPAAFAEMSTADAEVVATNISTNETFASLQDAIDDTQTVAGNTIVLNRDSTLSDKSIRITKSLTIDGGGKTVSTAFNKGANGVSNAALIVLAPNTAVKNITVNGNGTPLAAHGIVVNSGISGVVLANVTATNNAAGVIVNGSAVTIDTIHTTGNSWYGVDVDKTGAILTIKGANTHTEAAALYVDNTTIGQVVDADHQYGFADNVRQPGDRVYNLKLDAPAAVFPIDNGYATSSDFWFDWSDVQGAASYEWQASQSSATDGSGVLNHAVWAGDYQHVQPTNSTLHSVGASGTWYWQVRGVDAAGVKGVWSPVWKMTIDTTPPAAPANLSWMTSTGTVVANNGVTNAYSGTAKWSASTSSDFDHYVYKYWNDIAGNQYKAGSEYVVSSVAGTSLPGLFTEGDGVHHFCVAAVDHAGNQSACTEFTIAYDTTKPSVQNLTLNSTLTGGNTLTLSGQVSDDNLLNYQVRIQTPAHVNTNPYIGASGTVNTDGVLASLDINALPDGDYVVRLWATDKVGNSTGNDGITTYYLPFTVDRTPPVVAYTSMTHDVAGGTDTIKGTTNDSAPVVVTVDGTSYTVTPSGGTWSLTLTGLTVGTHNGFVSSKDAQGNQSVPIPFTVTIPPVDTGGTQIDSLVPLSARLDTSRQRTNSLVAGASDTTDAATVAALNSASPQGKVLGTQDAKTNLDQTAAIAPSAQGWTFWGIAWYWFVLIAATVAGITWFVIAARRRSHQAS